MRRFRTAVRWWVFLPFAPIFFALVSEYSAELFHGIGFHRLESAAHALSALDCFALIPYMALVFEVFGPMLSMVFGPLGQHSSLEFFMLLMSLPAAACCLLLYGVRVVVEITFNKHI